MNKELKWDLLDQNKLTDILKNAFQKGNSSKDMQTEDLIADLKRELIKLQKKAI